MTYLEQFLKEVAYVLPVSWRRQVEGETAETLPASRFAQEVFKKNKLTQSQADLAKWFVQADVFARYTQKRFVTVVQKMVSDSAESPAEDLTESLIFLLEEQKAGLKAKSGRTRLDADEKASLRLVERLLKNLY